ncbi:uncharacterized protein DS421_12g384770 [Arachis hypogaea]|nr:uncharacterized protein DS421_12g384770 [Arachis hypogaea]
MAKHGMLYLLIILIIGTIICYVNIEFDSFIRDNEKAWYPTLDDISYLDLELCRKKCDQTYNRFSSSKSRHRWQRCIQLCKKLNEDIENMWGTKE